MRYRAIGARGWQRIPVSLRRRIVHWLMPTYTVGVAAVVLNDRSEILLLRHRFRESTDWELPGGFVGASESPEDALRREMREETGLDVRIDCLAATRIAQWKHLDICFRCSVVGGTLRLDRGEVTDGAFFPVSALPQLDRRQREAIESVLQA
ncbi:MAG TPA: NUDIX domain-containing protein [Chloroflexota bacterium]|nr:NUDIX domain-containing protein [Chloroflexota bacterium]